MKAQRRGIRKVLGLCCALGLAGARAAQDGTALVQGHVQLRTDGDPEDSELPSGQQPHRGQPAGQPQPGKAAAIQSAVKDLPRDKLPPNMTMEELLQMSQEMLQVVQDPAFAAAFDGFTKGASGAMRDYGASTKERLARLDADSANRTRPDVRKALNAYFHAQGQALATLAAIAVEGARATVAAMPPCSVRDKILPPLLGGNLTVWDEINKGFNIYFDELFKQTGPGFCEQTEGLLWNMSAVSGFLTDQVAPKLNRTAPMIDEVKAMVWHIDPAAATPLVKMLTAMLETTTEMVRVYNATLASQYDVLGQVLHERLRCAAPEKGASSRLGPQLLAVALTLAAWLTLQRP